MFRSRKKKVDKRWVSRRQFLVGTGTALALPPLLSMMPRRMAAQAGAGKKVRAVIYVGHNGVDPQHIYPSFPNEPAGMAQVPGEPDVYQKPLSSFSGPISRLVDSEFAPVLDKTNILQGLSLCGGNYQGHNESVLSGTHSGGREPIYGKSIDVVLEQSAGVYAATDVVPIKALRITNYPTDMSFDRIDGVRTNTSAIYGDQNVFNTLFAGLEDPMAPPPPNPFPDDLIVDRVLEDLHALERDPRMSSEDGRLLARYVDGVHEVQTRIEANRLGLAPTCGVPSIDFQSETSGNGWQFPWNDNWNVRDASVLYDNIMDMIRLAFACDLTRVVFISNTHWSDDVIASSSSGGLHHECPSSEVSADRQKWGLKKLLRLATGLDSTPDPHGEGTLLDNSIMLWTNELGAWTTAHNTFSMPAITFGGGGGYFNTGYHVDYRQRPLRLVKGFHPGRPYKQLLQSIMTSMGVPASEYMAFGDGNGFGEFDPRVNQFGLNEDVFGRFGAVHNDPLPFVSS